MQENEHANPELELLDLLARIERDDTYYGPLSPRVPEYHLLMRVRRLGLARYCPYPDECWVVTQQGKDHLKKRILKLSNAAE